MHIFEYILCVYIQVVCAYLSIYFVCIFECIYIYIYGFYIYVCIYIVYIENLTARGPGQHAVNNPA